MVGHGSKCKGADDMSEYFFEHAWGDKNCLQSGCAFEVWHHCVFTDELSSQAGF